MQTKQALQEAKGSDLRNLSYLNKGIRTTGKREERRGMFPKVKKKVKKGTGYFFPVSKLLSKHDRLLFFIGLFFTSLGGPGFRRCGIMLSEFLPGWLLTSVYLTRHCVCPL